MGHSTLVANKHYWQVTDADFDKATGRGKAAQKEAQQPPAVDRSDSYVTLAAPRKSLGLPRTASLCGALRNGGMGDEGLGPPTPSV